LTLARVGTRELRARFGWKKQYEIVKHRRNGAARMGVAQESGHFEPAQVGLAYLGLSNLRAFASLTVWWSLGFCLQAPRFRPILGSMSGSRTILGLECSISCKKRGSVRNVLQGNTSSAEKREM